MRRIFWRALAFVGIAGAVLGIRIPWAWAETRITVLLSEPIRPYVEAVEGFSDAVFPAKVVRFTLKSPGKGLPAEVRHAPGDLVLAVGPQATRRLLDVPGNIPRLYAMVLDPEDIIPPHSGIPGVSLNIPPSFQMRVIARVLPNIRNVGVFFDPRYSSKRIHQLRRAARANGLRLSAVPVHSKGALQESLATHLPRIDALLMIPDPTVISESVVTFVIKEALKARVPVIGYNRFFWSTGALISFIIDYRGVGRKAAFLARKLLNGTNPGPSPPPVGVRVNRKIAGKFGFVLGDTHFPEEAAAP